MPESTAQRTLVKSPPELWAEVSDAASLARHLGEFGEIRITRLEPETTVAWEGDRVCGTVKLEPSGWGTKVTLTAELPEQVEPEAAPVLVEPEPEPEPVAVVPPPPPRPQPTPPEPVRKPGLFARLFGRKPGPALAAAEQPPAAEPVPVEPAEPVPVEPAEPVAAAPAPVEPARDPEPAPVEPAEPAMTEDTAVAVLTSVLDDLGSAHHRPFSRS